MLVIFSYGPARAQRSTTSSYLHSSFLFQEPLVFVFKQKENYSGRGKFVFWCGKLIDKGSYPEVLTSEVQKPQLNLISNY